MMATTAEGRSTPAHLWIVGMLGLFWNLFGAFDYFMMRTKGAEWIRNMLPGPEADRYVEYIDQFPIWASIGWGLGVWVGLAGAILLLMRNRLAVPAFGLSLVGAILGIGYQLANPVDIPEMSRGFNAVVPYLVIVIAAALFLYARAMQKQGVLR
ncbi:MAG TPA: hypothetical protein VJT70_02145 [Sphingomicrobium sp.]|nr:hypothetical protein [Sphingomicrobium sp.]